MFDIGRDRHGLISLHQKLTENRGWAAANNAVKLLSYLYNRAIRIEEDLSANPTVAVTYNKDRTRDTALSDERLTEWFDSVTALTNPVKRLFWITVLFTGARRNQLTTAEWSHIDLGSSPRWHFPDENAKAGRGYDIPLSPFVAKMLRAWRHYVEQEYPTSPQCRFVFPSAKSKSGHLESPRNERQGLTVSAHPLRHTFRTQGIAVRLSKTEAKILMGHKLSRADMDERYITRSDAVEKVRPQQEAMTARYMKLLGLTDASIESIIWPKNQ